MMVQQARVQEGQANFPQPLSRLQECELADDIDHVRRAEEEQFRKKTLRAKCRPSARASLLGDAMSDHQAVVQKVQSGGRIEVLINFFGGKIRVG